MHPVLLLTVVCCVEVLCEQQYTNKYDNINLENIIQNDRLFKNYVNCLLEKGKCTADAVELKKSIPDALASDCSKCSPKQKEGMVKIIKYLTTNKREIWNEIVAKYDPEGVYRTKFADLAKKENINF